MIYLLDSNCIQLLFYFFLESSSHQEMQRRRARNIKRTGVISQPKQNTTLKATFTTWSFSLIVSCCELSGWLLSWKEKSQWKDQGILSWPSPFKSPNNSQEYNTIMDEWLHGKTELELSSCQSHVTWTHVLHSSCPFLSDEEIHACVQLETSTQGDKMNPTRDCKIEMTNQGWWSRSLVKDKRRESSLRLRFNWQFSPTLLYPLLFSLHYHLLPLRNSRWRWRENQ